MICVVEKATGHVWDINQQFDTLYFDHLAVPDGTIPSGADPRKYFRDGFGNIVLRSAADLEAAFPDEWKKRAITRIDVSILPDGVKALLKEIVARL